MAIFFRALKGVLLVAASLAILAGCGYRFAGNDASRLSHLKTFFVEGFVNKTADAYSETIVRTAFTGRFVQEGRFRLAKSREDADVVCRGIVMSARTTTLSYQSSQRASEERLTVVLAIVLEERATGKVLWEDKGAVATGDYLVGSPAVTERNRKNALIKLAADSAERAYHLMMSDF